MAGGASGAASGSRAQVGAATSCGVAPSGETTAPPSVAQATVVSSTESGGPPARA